MLSVWLHETRLRIKALLRRKQMDRDLEEELAFHLAMREAKSDPQETIDQYSARKQFGNVTRLKEACREMWTFHFLETLWQDVRYGARMLRKNPGFATVAILTLALGIGANTAIFSITYQILLRTLPIPNPDELVILRSPGPNPGRTRSDGDPTVMFSYPMYKDLRDHSQQAFTGLLGRLDITLNVAGAGFTERANGEMVSGNYFDVLGVHPVVGRVLSANDETAPGANPVAVLSYGYWTRRFGNNSAVLNQQLTINGTSLTVVGVTQRGFAGVQVGQMPDIFVPVTMKAQMTPNWDGLNDHSDHWLAIMGRLKPGVTAQAAKTAMLVAYRPLLEAELPIVKPSKKNEAGFLARKIFLDPGARGRPTLQKDAQQPLIFLGAMVGLVLMIGCANLASLLIAKGESRQREVAVRLSLGAGRLRILRQLLTESLLLALAGGLVSLVVASWTLHAMVHTLNNAAGILALNAQLNPVMLAYTLAVALFTAILFGFFPALRVVRATPQASLRSQTSASGGTGNVRLRKWLMVFQVSLTVLLLAGAGLLTQSLVNISRTNLGVQKDHVMQFAIAPELNRYTPGQTTAFMERLRSNLSSLPGVRSASAAEIPVFADTESTGSLSAEGFTAPEDDATGVERNWISPGYFTTMGTALVAGRDFTEADRLASPQVAVVNETLVRHFFPSRNPVGSHIGLSTGPQTKLDIEVVGVVQDSKHNNARDPVTPFVYMPYAQDKTFGSATVYVRTVQDPETIVPMLRRSVAALDVNLPIYEVKTLARQVDESMFLEQLMALLSTILGSLAAMLAAIGLYGVMAYMVARRTREIGIRIALGATRRGITWLILREVVRMTGFGLAIGLVLSVLAGKSLEWFLFGVKGSDPVVLAFTVGMLAVVALFAGGLPAHKAASVDPVIALRYE